MTDSKTKRVELSLPEDVYKKFEDAANELNALGSPIKYDARMLITQNLDQVDYEDLINDTMLYIQKYLRELAGKFTKRRKDSPEPASK